jgi:hypothetical protein
MAGQYTKLPAIQTSVPVGGATAANQVLEIAQLTAINSNTTGAATAARQDTGNTSLAAINTKTPALGQALAAASVPVVLTAAQITTLTPLSAVTVSGSVTANAGTNLNTSALALESGGNLASLNTKLPAQGQALAAASLPVVLTAIQQAALTPLTYTTATSTLSNVASSATNVTILASNANRKGMMLFNDSSATLYLKFGATASTTSYTVQIGPNGYYEAPASVYLYTGIMDGIWSAANGSARVTELS